MNAPVAEGMSHGGEDDVALVMRTLAGDRAAFGTLVQRYEEPVRRVARAVLHELPERYRIAIVLFDVEGFAHAEIAEILGVAVGTVRSAVFHARRRLRELLADWKE